ncbi:hypothetical protein [Rhodopirellula europaea]|uniref:hypothetical protein n=1 Tax=Rhodopirellula europaea TaxID=1263866 RepID=UPI003D26D411
MKSSTRSLNSLQRLCSALNPKFISQLLAFIWRVIAAVQSFSTAEITPASTDKFERRLERIVRELARLVMQRTIQEIESIQQTQRPKPAATQMHS